MIACANMFQNCYKDLVNTYYDNISKRNTKKYWTAIDIFL